MLFVFLCHCRPLLPGLGIIYRVAPKKKRYDSVNSCWYCQKKIKQKMKRHLETVHACEERVKAASTGTKGEQQAKFQKLLNEGNFEHNMRVLEAGHGELLLRRRPSRTGIPISSFLPCPSCKAFMLKDDLYKHGEKCSERSASGRPVRTIVTEAECMLPSPENDVPVSKLVDGIRDKAVRDVIMSDPTLLDYVRYTMKTKGTTPNQVKTLKNRLRLLAKLLIRAREMERANMSMRDLCTPARFEMIVNISQELGGREETDGQPGFKIPSVPRAIGQALGKVIMVLESTAIKLGDENHQKMLAGFDRLHKIEWSDRVNRASHHTVNMRRQKKDDGVPSTQDMKMLSELLKNEVKMYTTKLQSCEERETRKHYNKLVESTSLSLLVFNKRRGGEAVKIKVRDYTERVDHTQNEVVLQSLNDEEKELMGEMTLIKTSGKRDRTVPVLIPPEEKEAIDTLVSCRPIVGLDKEDGFLFGKSPKGSHINAWYALKQACGRAGVGKVTSTSMRKYLATVAQVMNLNDTEMDQLASHLGHDIRVHRKHYRLQDSTVEMAKVANVLRSTEKRLGENLNACHAGPHGGGRPAAGGTQQPPADRLATADRAGRAADR